MRSAYRLFCTSQKVLSEYEGCLSLTESHFCTKLLQSVQLSLRGENVYFPDHIHRNRRDFAFGEEKCLADLLLCSLGAGSFIRKQQANLLTIHNNKLYVKNDFLEEWQCEVTAHQCPVPLLVAEWEAHGFEQKKSLSDTEQHVAQMLTYSTLPSFNENRLHDLIQNEQESCGNLHDLHIHFNGTTEFAQVWLYSLSHPRETLMSLVDAFVKSGRNGKVQFYYKQRYTHPIKMYMLLKRAMLLRKYMCDIIRKYFFGGTITLNRVDIYNAIAGRTFPSTPAFPHPFLRFRMPLVFTDLQAEGIMWIYMLRLLRKAKSFDIAMLAHAYILLQNSYLRLLVQQRDQYGFDQFQYITLLGAREPLEDSNTKERFVQVHGMYGPDLAHVEARYSPKSKVYETISLLDQIWRGYRSTYGSGTSVRTLNLGLVAHFIKEKDSENGLYRHQEYRAKLYVKARALVEARKKLKTINYELYRAMVGKDAASNELETSPEVFAPIFRYLELEGICNTTYHAGEDFEHIVSGMRAVYEAITFLQLKSGDRIGHGTALGISPECIKTDYIYCSKGQWFDNLVWLTWLISEKPELAKYGKFLPIFEKKIQIIYREIHDSVCPELSILWRAWRMRDINISVMTGVIMPSFQHAHIESQKVMAAKKDIVAFTEFKKYHSVYFREQWKKQIPIYSSSLDIKLLCSVQDAIISEMRQKNILIEVLPTSNVRISHYEKTEEHHVLRWLDEDDPRPAPQVVLGTDNPGIFSTNLRNEYALLLHNLQKKYAANADKPYQIIQHIIDNGRSYRFK